MKKNSVNICSLLLACQMYASLLFRKLVPVLVLTYFCLRLIDRTELLFSGEGLRLRRFSIHNI